MGSGTKATARREATVTSGERRELYTSNRIRYVPSAWLLPVAPYLPRWLTTSFLTRATATCSGVATTGSPYASPAMTGNQERSL